MTDEVQRLSDWRERRRNRIEGAPAEATAPRSGKTSGPRRPLIKEADRPRRRDHRLPSLVRLGGAGADYAASGVGPFENDDAAGFRSGLEESRVVSEKVRSALSSVAHTDAYVDVPDACIAIAAAAIVAIKAGGRLTDVADEDRQWVAALAIDDEAVVELAPMSAAALDRVRSKDSELLELWDAAQGTNAFLASIEGIRRGLPLQP